MKMIPNILLNASFEIEDDGDGVPDGWLSTGSPVQGTIDGPVHGNYYADIPSGSTLYQTRAAKASANYAFAIKCVRDYDISITEYNAAGTPTAVKTNDTDTEASWTWYTHKWVTQNDTVEIKITLAAGVGDCSYDAAALGYYDSGVDPVDLDPTPVSHTSVDDPGVVAALTLSGRKFANTPVGPIGGQSPVTMMFPYLTAAQLRYYRQYKGRQMLIEDWVPDVYYAVMGPIRFSPFSEVDTTNFRVALELTEVAA